MSKLNPDHYQLPNGFQVIDLTSQLDFCSGNCVKYIARAGKKDGESALDDLLKARFYLDRLIDSEETERKLNEMSSKDAVPEPNSFDRHTFVSDYFVAEDLEAWRDAT